MTQNNDTKNHEVKDEKLETQKNIDNTNENNATIEEDITTKKNNEEKTKRVLRAIERILDTNDEIIAICDSATKKIEEKLINNHRQLSEKSKFRRIGREIVAHYSNRSSLAGGVSGIPMIIPGIGSIVGFVGASLFDTVVTLKFEIEMALALCHLAGFNIEKERDRQIAYTLASVSSYEVRKSDDALSDTAQLSAAAFWDYSTRQMGKFFFSSLAKRVLMATTRHVTKVIPIVGIAIGLSMNKALTRRMGLQCLDALWLRRPRARVQKNADIFDANFEA